MFEGGGVRGIAFVGAIEVMESRGYVWQRLAGTSAGSIVAALLACNYSSSEIKKLMESLDYNQLLGRTGVNNLPVLNKAVPLQAHDQRHVDKHSEERSVFIPTESVTTTKFDLTEKDKQVLLTSGRAAAEQFLKKWNFEAYKRKFREKGLETPVNYYLDMEHQEQEQTIYH